MSDTGSTNPPEGSPQGPQTFEQGPSTQAQPQYFNQSSQQPPKKGMSTGGKIGIGCGILFLLALLGIGGCVAVVAIVGDDAATEFERGLEDGFNESLGQTSGVDVTREEFERVQNGMTRAEVESIFGAPGNETSSNVVGDTTISTYSWDGNTTFSTVNVTFENDTVSGKLQTGLE